ncbi:3-deoxy-D-manno-octulosonic acid kinase [Marinomonas sp. BSi20584]|uniref:3-deoxy-D-manno-octulosonic acid kinase n=1 Tax=Marinomonas sp. BSi20584 TaxID=1594462 RepID=UPI000C1DDA8E|nr:3-deoxy-D-manno-octulosonic acid kinase [Marinomonas sp. BSi20584]PJE53978.1 3-deoxy-D-manno-octulosonic acid kinase [Marinomonas sp. BSi20584]
MPQTINISPDTTLLKSDQTLPLSAAWFDPEFWQSQQALHGTGNGRGAVWFINSQFGQFVIRRYRRGGLIAKFNKSRFLFTGLEKTRPWLELSLLEKMNNLSLPVPRPIGGALAVKYGFYQAELLTETIKDAQDLFDIIKSHRSPEIDWNEIGTVIKRFHNNGIYHSDLNCHNIMIDNQHKVWVIDFDKCEQKEPHQDWMRSNIDRLKRSITKESNKYSNFHVSEEQWQAFLEGYHG